MNKSRLNNISYFFLFLFQTLICGLLGLPPCNGVLPQAPMHTKSLAVLRRQVSERLHRGKKGGKKTYFQCDFHLVLTHSIYGTSTVDPEEDDSQS